MPIFYWPVDTTTFILQPQTTRWRSRYRGPRESWKQNLEINQIAYDIYQLYNRTNNDELIYEQNAFNIEFGTEIYNSVMNFSFTMNQVLMTDSITVYDTAEMYDIGSATTTDIDINGTQDLIRRIQELQIRVNNLEQQS